MYMKIENRPTIGS